MYPKNVQENLTTEQIKRLKGIIEVSMKDELFQELLESVKQGAAIMKGELQPSRTFELSSNGRKNARLPFPQDQAVRS